MANLSEINPAILSNRLQRAACALVVSCGLAMIAVPAANAQTFSVLYSFAGGAAGGNPETGLTLDRADNLYGTTEGHLYEANDRDGVRHGSSENYGTVFKLTNHGGGWTLSTLYTFTGSNGANPSSSIAFGRSGALYGTTQFGGQIGAGSIYVLTPPATFCRSISCPWSEAYLYSFTGGSDSQQPQGNLAFDSSGNFYGTAAGDPEEDGGNVWQLSQTGDTLEFNVLYRFTGVEGEGPAGIPLGGVILSGGDLYGTTSIGGTCGGGTIFQLAPSGSGWNEQILSSFCSQGGIPHAGVVADASGNLYGATYLTGYAYELSLSGGMWVYTTLLQLSSGDGPVSDLTLDSQGDLYGTIPEGGAHQKGTVFKLRHTNGLWTYTDLYDFTGGDDGYGPVGSIILDASGNIYGTAQSGGANGYGTVWEITPELPLVATQHFA